MQQHLAQDPDLVVLDVRQSQEWHEGHIAGALCITDAVLPARHQDVPRDLTVAETDFRRAALPHRAPASGHDAQAHSLPYAVEPL